MSYYTQAEATLDQFVRNKPSNKTSYYSLSLLENNSEYNIQYDVHNVLSDYILELKELSQEITLSDEEYRTYRFRPKLLANYLYGNGELYFIILWLNDMWSVKQFDLRKVKLISKTELSEFLSKVNSSEKSFIKTYNQSSSDN